jgi:hypothetical protein
MVINPNSWHLCDETMATQLAAATYHPGQVYPYPLDALPEKLRTGMQGLTEVYVSGYRTETTVRSDFTALGEFAVARTVEDTGKGYNFAFGVSSDSSFYFAGPCTTFSEYHHWPSSQATPVSALFGHSDYYYSTNS